MVTQLVEKMVAGDRQALSRLLSLLERDVAVLPSVMTAVYPFAGRAYCVGLTGPPGAGKSTLIDGLIPMFRGDGSTVGVLAVDPTSSFTGGAVLGDRVRMQHHSLDRGVYIRSLATRGVGGGLSRVAGAAVTLLDAFGCDIVLVETVGVGQTELDIMGVVDSVVVVLVPEAGDAVQALKAGLREIADIFVVNKADRPGAGQVAAAIKGEVRSAQRRSRWTPPVMMTQADSGEGISDLHQAIVDHRAKSGQEGLERRRRQRRRREFTEALRASIEARIAEVELESDELGDLISRVEDAEIDPYSAAAQAAGDADFVASLVEKLRDSSSRPLPSKPHPEPE